MRLSCFLLFVILVASVSGQNRVTGKVLDAETGEGLLGAHVYLLKDWRTGTVSDVDGSFSLMTKQDGDTLIVSFTGFEEKLIPVSSQMIIELTPIKIEGEEVTITTKRLIAEEFKYLSIGKLDIYTNPSAKADPVLAVNALPSSTTTDESANISLRGSRSIETGIFLNNSPIYDAVRYSQLNGIGTFSIFNTAMIKEVVVFPGNPPLEFGNTTSGVISLTTDERILEQSTNSVVASLANVGVLREQFIDDNQSLKVFSNWQPSGAIKAINETSLEEIESFKSGDLGIYWYGSNSKLNWKIFNYSVSERYQFNFLHPSYEGRFNQRKKRSFLNSSVVMPLSKGSINFSGNLSMSRGNYDYSNVRFQVDNNDLFTGINYLISTSSFSLKSGFTYDYRQSKVSGNFHEYGYALGPNHPTIHLNETSRVRTMEGYAYFKYFPTDKLVIGTGLRKNIPHQDQGGYLSSQLNIAYTDQPWSIILGAGEYHKSGFLENSGESFTSSSEQLSIDIKLENAISQVALSLFTKSNLISAERYKVYGAELFVDHRLSGKLKGSTSVTLLDIEGAQNSQLQNVNYFIRGNVTYNPASLWTIDLILMNREGSSFQPVEAATFDASLDVYEPQYNDQFVQFEDYMNLSASISKIFPISENLSVIAFASINNVLDRRNIRTSIYDREYSTTSPALFSRRTSYFGAVVSF